MKKTWKNLIKLIVVIAAAGLAVYCALGLIRLLAPTIVHNGTTMTFTTDADHYLRINAVDGVTLEAASSDFFVLYTVDGLTLTPKPVTPPLGLNSATYYVFGPNLVLGGAWYVIGGDPIIQITNNVPVTVTEIPTKGRSNDVDSGMALVGFLIFASLLLILYGLGFFQW
jgi:hypothetical protein